MCIANALAQLLTVPPYAVTAVVLVLFSYASDRLQGRGIFIAVFSSVAGVGYLYDIPRDDVAYWLKSYILLESC
jgi:hypothetical protein